MQLKSTRNERIENRNIEALIDFAESEAYCPCCEGVLKCLEGCTIKKDSERVGAPISYERMMAARKALLIYNEN